jgi:hypothetical protein
MPSGKAVCRMFFWFNRMGVIVATFILLAIPITLITRDLIRHSFRAWKVTVYAAVYIIMQVTAVTVLLNDFAKPSIVDLSVLVQVGDSWIDEFDEREPVLQASSHLQLRRAGSIFSYRYTYHGNNVQLTIYRLPSPEAAHQNLLAAAKITAGQVLHVTATAYGYAADSVYQRDRYRYMTPDLHREVRTYFVIGDTLFSLLETGDRDRIGEGTNAMIARLLDVFIH